MDADMQLLRSRTTTLLGQSHSGSTATVDRVFPLVYDQLKHMARGQLGREGGQRPLQTTALVHEAYLKLVDQTQVTDKGRAYFFGAAARAMRQILVDHARQAGALKRGGGEKVQTLDEDVASESAGPGAFADQLLDLHNALDRLASRSPRQAQVVECRYFGGLSFAETADALDLSARTVKYDWAMARAWLYGELGGAAGGTAGL